MPKPSPRSVMKWSEGLYKSALSSADFGRGGLLADDISLQEHDYCIGKRKFGGNAQSFSKDRFVHHTSLLWDFSEECMQYLLLPEKRPAYRNDRGHLDFLCSLKEYFPTQDDVMDTIVDSIGAKGNIELVELDIDTLLAEDVLSRPHRKSNREVVP